VLIGQ